MLLLSVHDEPSVLRSAVAAGAEGIILKRRSPPICCQPWMQFSPGADSSLLSILVGLIKEEQCYTDDSLHPENIGDPEDMAITWDEYLSIETSTGLQRLARRQRIITLIAIPGILACMAAIAYLVFR